MEPDRLLKWKCVARMGWRMDGDLPAAAAPRPEREKGANQGYSEGGGLDRPTDLAETAASALLTFEFQCIAAAT